MKNLLLHYKLFLAIEIPRNQNLYIKIYQFFIQQYIFQNENVAKTVKRKKYLIDNKGKAKKTITKSTKKKYKKDREAVANIFHKRIKKIVRTIKIKYCHVWKMKKRKKTEKLLL